MITKFETFTYGDLDDNDKMDLDNYLDFYQGMYEFPEDLEEEMKEIVKKSIEYFNSKLPIFDKIHVQFTEELKDDTLGMYVHESALRIPIILLSRKTIKEAVEDDYNLELVIRSTIFHELGHALADIDNHYTWIENENILDYDDEEEFAENFAFELDMYGIISEDIVKLMHYYKNEKPLDIDYE